MISQSVLAALADDLGHVVAYLVADDGRTLAGPATARAHAGYQGIEFRLTRPLVVREGESERARMLFYGRRGGGRHALLWTGGEVFPVSSGDVLVNMFD